MNVIGKHGNGGDAGLAGSHGDIWINGFENNPQFTIDSLEGKQTEFHNEKKKTEKQNPK